MGPVGLIPSFLGRLRDLSWIRSVEMSEGWGEKFEFILTMSVVFFVNIINN